MSALSNDALRGKTAEFKLRLSQGESLDDLLPEAFAICREGAKRVAGMRHFDVQMIGGIVLHQGDIAEMTTGEGKTLVATLPVYLNALSGKGVHVVTVNDYLARRDKEWMGPIHEFLGLTVGLIQSGMSVPEKQVGYRADITYGTNNEFGFDYLRDNIAHDSREPPPCSGHVALRHRRRGGLHTHRRGTHAAHYFRHGRGVSSDMYATRFRRCRAEELAWRTSTTKMDEKQRAHHPYRQRHGKGRAVARRRRVYIYGRDHQAGAHLETSSRFQGAINFFKRDKEYMVMDQRGESSSTSSPAAYDGAWRRYSEGLHQALEAKEGVPLRFESQTVCFASRTRTIFRLYDKLAGMTGTAVTEFGRIRQASTNSKSCRYPRTSRLWRACGRHGPHIRESNVASLRYSHAMRSSEIRRQRPSGPRRYGESIEKSELSAKAL